MVSHHYAPTYGLKSGFPLEGNGNNQPVIPGVTFTCVYLRLPAEGNGN